MIILGVDPDLHATSFVWLGSNGVLDVRVARVPKKIVGDEAVDAMCDVLAGMDLLRTALPDLVVVEGQHIVRGEKGTKNPVDILRLAQVAGAASCAARRAYRSTKTIRPTPAEWKGQVPKEVHQARVLRDQGWGTMEAGLAALGTRWPEVTTREWLHVVDALGLAQWGRKKLALATLVSRSSEAKPSRTSSPAAS